MTIEMKVDAQSIIIFLEDVRIKNIQYKKEETLEERVDRYKKRLVSLGVEYIEGKKIDEYEELVIGLF